eukprot:860839-Pelagomonas_calceolata.AAC.1
MPCMQLLPFLGLPCARGSFAFWGMLYEDKLICIGQTYTQREGKSAPKPPVRFKACLGGQLPENTGTFPNAPSLGPNLGHSSLAAKRPCCTRAQQLSKGCGPLLGDLRPGELSRFEKEIQERAYPAIYGNRLPVEFEAYM